MKPHYFKQEHPDDDDVFLKISIKQGYVPATCLLGGQVVLGIVNQGRDPCKGCQGPRNKCHGRDEQEGGKE